MLLSLFFFFFTFESTLILYVEVEEIQIISDPGKFFCSISMILMTRTSTYRAELHSIIYLRVFLLLLLLLRINRVGIFSLACWLVLAPLVSTNPNGYNLANVLIGNIHKSLKAEQRAITTQNSKCCWYSDTIINSVMKNKFAKMYAISQSLPNV